MMIDTRIVRHLHATLPTKKCLRLDLILTRLNEWDSAMNVLLLVLWSAFYVHAATIPISSPAQLLDDALLLWGPYRPNLYLGLRPRIPKSLMTGLMWYNSDDVSKVAKHLRHTCEQNEGMAGYGWKGYDARSGGTQVINDTGNGVDLIVDFDKTSATEKDQRWELVIQGKGRAGTRPDQKMTLVFYIGNEHSDSSLSCARDHNMGDRVQLTPQVNCEGNVPSQFMFKAGITSGQQEQTTNDILPSTSVYSMHVESDAIWTAKDIFLNEVESKAQHTSILPDMAGPGNLQFIQMTFSGDFNLRVVFHSSTDSNPTSLSLPNTVTDKTRRPFEKQFAEVYEPQDPFQEEEGYRSFSNSLLSNLMGGIGFFHGTSKVSSDVDAEKTSLDSADVAVTERGPYELFSAVPSRPFFPRGFLWDEGFHLQVILDWDMDLALTILTSWLDLMDDDGWIAREQILGPEARSKVPPEFQTQYQHYANPPTMFRVIEMFVDRITGLTPYHGAASRYMDSSATGSISRGSEAARTFLGSIYQKLAKHYEWFIRTQSGNLDRYNSASEGTTFSHGYHWRGQTAQHILASGLDDYPRAPTPSEDDLHLDALCWVGSMAKILHKVAVVLSLDREIRIQYSEDIDSILTTLEDIHWSEANQAYCDTTIDTSYLKSSKTIHICHKGYISLLPFLTGLLPPNHPHLASILSLIESPSQLWSPHGLRSLSASSPFYGTGEDYWRGPIWINFNYMALEQLLLLSQHQGPLAGKAALLYVRLRRNIVRTVYTSWKETGFAWEQYNAETGKGQRTQHFTGWTSLIVRVMAMPELEVDGTIVDNEGTVVQVPGAKGSWGGGNLLFIVTVIFIVCVLFRRRLFRVWRSWLEDR